VFRAGLSRYNGNMRLALKLHPDSTSAAASSVEVEIVRPSESALLLLYVVIGKTSGLRLPSIITPARADELWRHTCFEAFLSVPSHTGYYEFNFSPSTQWAAYRFSGYRSGMQIASYIDAPRIEVSSSPDSYTLQAALDLDTANVLKGAPWRLGLSAVIEETSGNKSYWALAHAPGKPDFHRADCFTHEFS
jgi:hypothetical protein